MRSVSAKEAEMAVKYVVLWMQGQQVQSMRPVAAIVQPGGVDSTRDGGVNKEGSVSYSRESDLGGAMRFSTAQEAVDVMRMVRRLYGEEQVLALIQDPPANGEWTQKRLDEWLPAWAYIKKYSRSPATA